MSLIWSVKNTPDRAVQLAKKLKLPHSLVQLLLNRGIDSPQAIAEFLSPQKIRLPHPFSLPDCKKGVERVVKAIKNGEKIAIYTDYDPDGHCSLAQLYLSLRRLGVPNKRLRLRVPDHDREGYGLNVPAVEELAQQGHTLMIAADCGITSVEEVARANELGMDSVIIDHHEPGPVLPEAIAVINPKRKDFKGDPLVRELAAAGLVHVFAWGLFMALDRQSEEDRRFLNGLVDLAGLATIADMVPLLGPNRRLAAVALRQMMNRGDGPEGLRPGIKALLKASSLWLDRDGLPAKVTAYHVGMRLAPKINAGRRMDDSRLAAKLLLTRNEKEAMAIAERLTELNNHRRGETDRALDEASRSIEDDLPCRRVIVAVGEDWRKGVVGLVAQRLVREHHRPAIALTRQEPDSDEVYTGSCRSIPGVSIHGLLTKCSDLLERFGGHEMAAGLAVRRENIPALIERLEQLASEYPDELFIPKAEAEIVCTPEEACSLLPWLPKLEPTGQGNPRPLIWIKGEVVNAREFGRSSDRRHLQLTLAGESGERLSLVGWGMSNAYTGFSHADVMAEWDGEALRIKHLRPLADKSNGSEAAAS